MHARLYATAALATALAVPATAQAAGTISATGIKVRGYEMTLVGSDNGSKDSLSVILGKGSGTSRQQHMYTFASGVKISRTSISASLGKYGSIKLKFGKTKSLKRGKLPKGCTGTLGRSTSGTLTGSVRFVADRSFFKTVRGKRMTGVYSSGAKLDCSGSGSGNGGGGDGDGGAQGGVTRLMLNSTDAGGSFTFLAMKRSQMAIRSEAPDATAPATITHMITSSGAGSLTVTPPAGATVPGKAPFLTGTGDFAGSALPGSPLVMGTLSGSLVAKFDSIPPVAIAGDAMLQIGND